MRSMVDVTMSQNVRDTCGIETGEHKQRDKRNCTQSKRTNMRGTKESREGNIGTCTNKSPKWKRRFTRNISREVM